MALVDWFIVIVIALAVLGGLQQGFFRSVCSLGGLLLGLVLAAWNYGRLAVLLMPLVRIDAVANTIAFVLIALLVMAVASLIGSFLGNAMHKIGLGCLDKLAGAAFGFFQGILMVTLIIWVTVAFFPRAHWLLDAKLPRSFFGACHLSTHISPQELAERVQHGLTYLEQESPRWMHPSSGGL
jgi:membrane protein required for colicin V production